MLYVPYLNFGRQLYKLSAGRSIAGDSLALEAQVLLNKWAARGLNPDVLAVVRHPGLQRSRATGAVGRNTDRAQNAQQTSRPARAVDSALRASSTFPDSARALKAAEMAVKAFNTWKVRLLATGSVVA